LELGIEGSQNVRYKIMDMLGKVIVTDRLGKVSGSTFRQLDVANLNTGSYFLYMQIGEREVVRRIAITK